MSKSEVLPRAEVHPATGQSPRRLPFFAVLLTLILVGSSPWLYSQIIPMIYYREPSSVVPSTPWHMMYNPFGPNFTYERAVDILNCSISNDWAKPSFADLALKDASSKIRECPSYFHWIEKDLAPWKQTGITRRVIDMAETQAAFKAVIVNGKLYIDRYAKCFGNRAVFTVFGLLLLLEKYQGQVPDLEMMFNCEDRPRLPRAGGPDPPALFGYCSNSDNYDIAFPDWSFWGWSDLMLESWDKERDKIVRGSQKKKWSLKVPKAYWSGNPFVGAPHREEMIKCTEETKTEFRIQNWRQELSAGKKNSKPEDQCKHRYMIYAEGVGWSVSLKYIMACGSPTLVISPAFHDFFSRGLQQWVHYIPVRPSELIAPELCTVLEKGVEAGEANITKAIQIGKAGQTFMKKEIAMMNVYDYMFHMLLEYSKLMRFQPSVPEASQLVTLDRVLCLADPVDRLSLQDAMNATPRGSTPCQMSSNTSGPEMEVLGWEVKVQ